MKKLNTLLLLIVLVSNPLLAQKITGVATYKTDRKVELKLDSTAVGNGMQDQIAAQLRKQFQKEFTLDFNAEESLYKEVEKLDAPQAASGGFQIKLSGGSDILYRNAPQQQIINQTEIMSKPFLVKDKAPKPEWELTKEVKNIGNYTCFKATWKRDEEHETFDSLTDEIVKKTVSKITTAWYTLDIPLQHGPSTYWGLPGLILEVDDGNLTILCSKVVLNPEKPVVIEMPEKGKEVTQAEFDAIESKKNKEMMDQFRSTNGRRGNGESIQIRIGG